MGPILTILTAIFLGIVALVDATSAGLVSIVSMLTLVLQAFGGIYVLFTFYRACGVAQ
jgi:hypothetical protein